MLDRLSLTSLFSWFSGRQKTAVENALSIFSGGKALGVKDPGPAKFSGVQKNTEEEVYQPRR